MRSFAALSFIATLAFSAFSGATPIVASRDVSSVSARSLEARCDSCPPPPPVPAPCDSCSGSGVPVVNVDANVKTAVVILTQLSTSIESHIAALGTITIDTCKEENITPHLKEISIALEAAVKLCVGLIGKTQAEILGDVNVTIGIFAQLLASIVIAVVTICAKLVILVKGNISICGPFFASVGVQLAALVKICIQLVPGCLSILLTLLVAVIPSIKVCSFADLLAILNIRLWYV